MSSEQQATGNDEPRSGSGPPATVTTKSDPKLSPDATPADPSPTPGAEWPYVVVGYLLAAGGVGLSLLFYPGHPSQTIKSAPAVAPAGVTVFAGLYIAAQAVERLLAPLSNVTGGILGFTSHHPQNVKKGTDGAPKTATKVVTKKQIAATMKMAKSPEGRRTGTAAQAEADTAQFRANSTVLMFGLATLLAGILTGALGLMLLHQVGINSAAVFWDLAVTTLAVGAGTKPLHDLIGNISASKEIRQDSQASSS